MNRQMKLFSIHLSLSLFGGTACLDVNPLAADADGDGQSAFEGDCDDSDPNHTGSFTWFKDADSDGSAIIPHAKPATNRDPHGF